MKLIGKLGSQIVRRLSSFQLSISIIRIYLVLFFEESDYLIHTTQSSCKRQMHANHLLESDFKIY